MVEDDVHAAPVGQLPGPGREVLAPVVDRGAGAEREAALALLLASGGHDQDDAGLARERDRRGADAASSSMDERGLAGGERAEPGHEEVREGGEEGLRKSRRLLVAHPVRDREHRPVVDHDILRVPATREERHDSLPPREAADRGAALDDRPGALEAENG